MTCEIHTARISYSGPDKLDVTRASAGPEGIAFAPSKRLLDAGKNGLEFVDYADRYKRELRGLWIDRRFVFEALLRRPRVVLCCYCTDPALCHRTVLAEALAGAGAKLGVEVVVRGEIGLGAAVAACSAVAKDAGKLTARDIVQAVQDAGAELCVIMTVLERMGTIPQGTYDKHNRALLKLAKQMRDEAGGATP
jgi:hypothetical protein